MNKRDVREYIAESPDPPTKNEIARAFSAKGQERDRLTRILKSLEKEGSIERDSGAYRVTSLLPDVTVLKITDIDIDGDVFARPDKWDVSRKGEPPRIEVRPDKKGHPSVSVGDLILARMEEQPDGSFDASMIRHIEADKNRTIGIVERSGKGYVLRSTDKKARFDYEIPASEIGDAKEGDMVFAEVKGGSGSGRGGALRKKASVTEVIGEKTDPKVFSLIAIHENGIRNEFPKAVKEETKNMAVPDLGDREDLRDIPLVTIDGSDARDFDDAVYCEKTDTGFHMIVAIADVSYYVRPGSALDEEAYARGNSTYFPDRVVPMLPEALSNGLCSLRPDEERACMAMHMWINEEGQLQNYKVVRGLMKSKARLTYEQVQEARNGNPDAQTKPLMTEVIEPLYTAYEVLKKAREERGALEIKSSERQILIDENNNMTGVTKRAQLDSHKLIEEFMIAANVAAGSILEKRKAPCMYRVHEKPDALKLDSIREFVEAFGLSLPKGQITGPKQLNKILEQANALPHADLIHQVILRSMSQAHYSTENKSHFGLSLKTYAHFTSPIRRYADLEVHRSLIDIFNLGPGALDQQHKATLMERAEHISNTERQSMNAERSTVDRFTAAFMEDKVGAEFTGRITGLTKAGLFIMLDETGADGFLPRRLLPDDFYIHNEAQHALIGRKSGRLYRLGATIDVRLLESNGMTGSTLFEPVGKGGADVKGANFKPAQTGRGRKNKRKRGGLRR